MPIVTRRIFAVGALTAAAVIGLPLAAAISQTSQVAPSAETLAKAKSLAGEHPAAYYEAAGTQFKAARYDDATFLFYLGQLRFRTHLLARRNSLKPDADPAAFASLSEILGRPINQYAFGDIPNLASLIEQVIAFDRDNPDRFTAAAEFREAHDSVRQGLLNLRTSILKDADSIRAERLRNGLTNRK